MNKVRGQETESQSDEQLQSKNVDEFFCANPKELPSGMLQSSVLDNDLTGVATCDSEDGPGVRLSTFTTDTKLGARVTTTGVRMEIRNDLSRKEQGDETNMMERNREKCEVLHLG